MIKKKRTWQIICLLVVCLIILAFSPLVISKGKFRPELLGMPYTLWMGILISIILVGLTYWGTKVHPGNNKKPDPE